MLLILILYVNYYIQLSFSSPDTWFVLHEDDDDNAIDFVDVVGLLNNKSKNIEGNGVHQDKSTNKHIEDLNMTWANNLKEHNNNDYQDKFTNKYIEDLNIIWANNYNMEHSHERDTNSNDYGYHKNSIKNKLSKGNTSGIKKKGHLTNDKKEIKKHVNKNKTTQNYNVGTAIKNNQWSIRNNNYFDSENNDYSIDKEELKKNRRNHSIKKGTNSTTMTDDKSTRSRMNKTFANTNNKYGTEISFKKHCSRNKTHKKTLSSSKRSDIAKHKETTIKDYDESSEKRDEKDFIKKLEWRVYRSVVCLNKEGADKVETLEDLTLKECKSACEDDIQCHGISRRNKDSSPKGHCTMWNNFKLDNCPKDSEYDTYIIENRVNNANDYATENIEKKKQNQKIEKEIIEFKFLVNSKINNMNKRKSSNERISMYRLNQLNICNNSKHFSKQGLDQHNKIRRLEGKPELIQSEKLCKSARKWAKHIAQQDKIVYNEDTKAGENIALASGCIDPISIVDMWNGEKESGENGRMHYAQIAWTATKKMCMVTEMAGNGKWYTVARYFPGKSKDLGKYMENICNPKPCPFDTKEWERVTLKA